MRLCVGCSLNCSQDGEQVVCGGVSAQIHHAHQTFLGNARQLGERDEATGSMDFAVEKRLQRLGEEGPLEHLVVWRDRPRFRGGDLGTGPGRPDPARVDDMASRPGLAAPGNGGNGPPSLSTAQPPSFHNHCVRAWRLSMNIRRGLFRLWAALSLGWVALVGVFAYGELPAVYQLAYKGKTYTFTRPDGSKFDYISPRMTNQELGQIAAAQKEPASAPPCNDSGATCEPWNRHWEGGNLKLLPGATVDSDGKIVGSYSVYDVFAFIEAKDAFWSKAKMMAGLGFARPILSAHSSSQRVGSSRIRAK